MQRAYTNNSIESTLPVIYIFAYIKPSKTAFYLLFIIIFYAFYLMLILSVT